jgi:hypothetical protein
MLRFSMLGQLTVDRAGRPVEVPAGRTRVLLGALIVHASRALCVDALTDMLWATSVRQQRPRRYMGRAVTVWARRPRSPSTEAARWARPRTPLPSRSAG